MNNCEKILPKPQQMRTYDESLKVYWDNYSVIETAKHEGREQGRELGRQEGKEEGIEIGASQKSIEIVRAIKKMAYPST